MGSPMARARARGADTRMLARSCQARGAAIDLETCTNAQLVFALVSLVARREEWLGQAGSSCIVWGCGCEGTRWRRGMDRIALVEWHGMDDGWMDSMGGLAPAHPDGPDGRKRPDGKASGEKTWNSRIHASSPTSAACYLLASSRRSVGSPALLSPALLLSLLLESSPSIFTSPPTILPPTASALPEAHNSRSVDKSSRNQQIETFLSASRFASASYSPRPSTAPPLPLILSRPYLLRLRGINLSPDDRASSLSKV